MKIIYVISWCVTSVTQIPCSDAFKVNEFGIIENLVITCNVLHTKTETKCGFTKSFTDKDSANLFYNNALKQSELSNIKIDTIK